MAPEARILDTDGLRIERHDTPLQYQALQLLVNPTIADLLPLGGAVGLALELVAPGSIGPGALGAVALVLGLYGTAQLPVTAAGVILLLLALSLLLAEIHAGSGGILGVAGVAALIVGGLLLFDTDSDAVAISVPAVVGCGALLGTLTLFTASRALAARHARPAIGDDELSARSARSACRSSPSARCTSRERSGERAASTRTRRSPAASEWRSPRPTV